MRLRLSPHVPGDLEEIADYIAQDSPRQAIRLLRELRSRMQEIAKQPASINFGRRLARGRD